MNVSGSSNYQHSQYFYKLEDQLSDNVQFLLSHPTATTHGLCSKACQSNLQSDLLYSLPGPSTQDGIKLFSIFNRSYIKRNWAQGNEVSEGHNLPLVWI